MDARGELHVRWVQESDKAEQQHSTTYKATVRKRHPNENVEREQRANGVGQNRTRVKDRRAGENAGCGQSQCRAQYEQKHASKAVTTDHAFTDVRPQWVHETL